MLDRPDNVQDRNSAGVSLGHCFYCYGTDLKEAYRGVYHKRKKDHGPFNLYECRNCGSLVTLPPPAPSALEAFYSTFQFGLSDFSRQLLSQNPEAIWHEECANRLTSLSKHLGTDTFTWIDVGAGGGELARILGNRFPASSGLAVDIHDEPPGLREGASSFEWRRIDTSQEAFASILGAKADMVFATGVWEHVRQPDLFVRNLLALLKPGGLLYMTTPNYGSIARRVMGASWPYLIPGEHLCMPTPKGARLCLSREISAIWDGVTQAAISTRPMLVRYGIRFVLAKLGYPRLARMVPSAIVSYLPSGALESVVRLPPTSRPKHR